MITPDQAKLVRDHATNTDVLKVIKVIDEMLCTPKIDNTWRWSTRSLPVLNDSQLNYLVEQYKKAGWYVSLETGRDCDYIKFADWVSK